MLTTCGLDDILTEYVYDDNNRLTAETRTEDGDSKTTNYTYDDRLQDNSSLYTNLKSII